MLKRHFISAQAEQRNHLIWKPWFLAWLYREADPAGFYSDPGKKTNPNQDSILKKQLFAFDIIVNIINIYCYLTITSINTSRKDPFNGNFKSRYQDRIRNRTKTPGSATLIFKAHTSLHNDAKMVPSLSGKFYSQQNRRLHSN